MLPTDFIIQARFNSSRLPGKVALILNNGTSVIQTLVYRLQKYISIFFRLYASVLIQTSAIEFILKVILFTELNNFVEL